LRRRIGLVSPALRHLLHDEEPALEVVIGGRYAAIDIRDEPKPRDVQQARGLLRAVGCLPLAKRPWAVLSQGERQRILIARALMAQPEVLILDEPCAGLDPVAREQFLALIAQLGRHARPTLLLVTHHVEEIVPAFRHALIPPSGNDPGSWPHPIGSEQRQPHHRVRGSREPSKVKRTLCPQPARVGTPVSVDLRHASVGATQVTSGQLTVSGIAESPAFGYCWLS
jgi:hypothetical protein